MTRKPITSAEARKQLGNVMAAFPTAEAPDWERSVDSFVNGGIGSDAYLTFRSGIWGGDATVYCKERVEFEENKCFYEIGLGWSSTHRTISMAEVTLAVYQKALSLAHLLQATIDGLPEVRYNICPVECPHCEHDFHGEEVCMIRAYIDDIECLCTGTPS